MVIGIAIVDSHLLQLQVSVNREWLALNLFLFIFSLSQAQVFGAWEVLVLKKKRKMKRLGCPL